MEQHEQHEEQEGLEGARGRDRLTPKEGDYILDTHKQFRRTLNHGRARDTSERHHVL